MRHRWLQVLPALSVCAVMLGAAPQTAAAETARLRTPASLLSGPSVTAKATGVAKAGAVAQILERHGFWARVSAGGASGWVKLSALSLSGSGSGADIAALASGRSGQGNVVSTSGGRGLDNGPDLTQGTPNPAAVAALSALAVSQDAAERYARAGGLAARTVAYSAAPRDAGSQ